MLFTSNLSSPLVPQPCTGIRCASQRNSLDSASHQAMDMLNSEVMMVETVSVAPQA